MRCVLIVSLSAAVLAAQTPTGRVHRLEATPETVAYGFYDAAAKPVLKIASGDIIDVDTLLTSTPARLERAGVKPEEVQASLRAIVDGVKDKGPGGHILTGPVFVEGAEPGDALEVRVLSIDLAIAYGELPAEQSHAHPDHPARSQGHDGDLCTGHRHSLASVFREHGRRAAAVGRPHQQ